MKANFAQNAMLKLTIYPAEYLTHDTRINRNNTSFCKAWLSMSPSLSYVFVIWATFSVVPFFKGL